MRKLVITATSITDRAIGLLVQNNRANTIHTLVVRTPRVAESDQGTAIEDIAVLTGGRVFYSAAQADFTDFQIADLGYARRAWATQSLFGLFGGTAILRVADATDAGSTARKTLALRAVTTLRHALSGGVVAGGEVALLHAQQTVAQLPAANADEAMAYKILHRALEEPQRTITQNAGYYPTTIIEQVKAAPTGCGFDARSGHLVDMQQHGIQDALVILQKAVAMAVSGAAQALTTDTIVHHRKPQECIGCVPFLGDWSSTKNRFVCVPPKMWYAPECIEP